MRYLTVFFMGCLLLLIGCASNDPTNYQQSSAQNEFGYTETKLTETQYRIEFAGNRFTEKSQINDYAMLRAAELTMQKGYDWFTVLASETDQETKTRPQMSATAATGSKVVRKCGLLGCSSYATADYSGFGIETYEVKGKVTTRIQISMGKGQAPNPNLAFNANELAQNLRNSFN